MLTRFLSLLIYSVVFFANVSLHSHNKIIYLISPPRSLSVAFMRMMEARGDFAIMHEPSQWAFNKSVHHDFVESWFIPEAAQTFDEVKERIFEQAKHTNVFVKEMSFAVDQFLLHDQEFIANPHVHFVFLLRNPHHAIISFYNRRNEVEDNNTSFAHLVGYQACYEIFQKIKSVAARKPYIILSEDLYTNPEATIKAFCAQVGIEYLSESLSWDNLGSGFNGQKEWHEIKYAETTQHWHGDAIKSTGFGRPHQYKVDEKGNSTFEEICNPLRKKICEDAYVENMKYYNLLLQECTKN